MVSPLYLPPPLSSKRLRVTVPLHPRGNLAQVTVPLHPQLLDKGRATQKKRVNTRACEPQNDIETACMSRMHVKSTEHQTRCATFFLTRVFHQLQLLQLQTDVPPIIQRLGATRSSWLPRIGWFVRLRTPGKQGKPGALMCDGLVISTMLRVTHSLGRHNTTI